MLLARCIAAVDAASYHNVEPEEAFERGLTGPIGDFWGCS